jgi:hypothetical protein
LKEKIEVISYCGYKADERPIKIKWGNKQFVVKKVISRWKQLHLDRMDEPFEYFKVLTNDRKEITLSFSPTEQQWYIESLTNK